MSSPFHDACLEAIRLMALDQGFRHPASEATAVWGLFSDPSTPKDEPEGYTPLTSVEQTEFAAWWFSLSPLERQIVCCGCVETESDDVAVMSNDGDIEVHIPLRFHTTLNVLFDLL